MRTPVGREYFIHVKLVPLIIASCPPPLPTPFLFNDIIIQSRPPPLVCLIYHEWAYLTRRRFLFIVVRRQSDSSKFRRF